MSIAKRLWTNFVRFAEALEGMDDSTGRYLLSLGKRIKKLERDVERLERQLHSSAGGGAVQQEFARITFHAD